VRLAHLEPLDPEATEVSLVSAVPPALLDLLVLAAPLALLVTMVPREMLEPEEHPVLRDPQVCRECPESAEPLACLDSRETGATVEPRVPMVPLVRMVSVV